MLAALRIPVTAMVWLPVSTFVLRAFRSSSRGRKWGGSLGTLGEMFPNPALGCSSDFGGAPGDGEVDEVERGDRPSDEKSERVEEAAKGLG